MSHVESTCHMYTYLRVLPFTPELGRDEEEGLVDSGVPPGGDSLPPFLRGAERNVSHADVTRQFLVSFSSCKSRFKKCDC